MPTSSIKKKRCKCGCNKYPTMGCGGYNYACEPAEIKEARDAKKKTKAEKKIIRPLFHPALSALDAYEERILPHEDTFIVNKALQSIKGGGAELKRWFIERRAAMTGKCAHCGGKSCRDSDQYFKFSIAHVLPKAYFPSVATHPDNWIELCHFGNSCHGNMDNKMLDLIEMNCFSSIVDKFVSMYPSIAANEKRRIPSVLLQYVEVEK